MRMKLLDCTLIGILAGMSQLAWAQEAEAGAAAGERALDCSAGGCVSHSRAIRCQPMMRVIVASGLRGCSGRVRAARAASSG